NGAQVVVDQFLASSESKWQRMSGLVLLLPHGYEGQGPEHSSARLERFLQLCAEDNMQVCNLTTPAQYFHVLRRQMHRSFRKPLVLMTPKSLLRHKLCVSSLEELTQGGFRTVIDDIALGGAPEAGVTIERGGVRRILLCSGKIYYELLAARRERAIDSVALVRVEQLYPFPAKELEAIFAAYPEARQVYWVQEEPWNMGAWHVMHRRLRRILPGGRNLNSRGRPEDAGPRPAAPAAPRQAPAAPEAPKPVPPVPAAPAAPLARAEAEAEPVAARAVGPLSPAVRRLLAEHDLDPTLVPASGKGGRLTK